MIRIDKHIHGIKNDKVIFLLGGWGSGYWPFWPIAKLLVLKGFCVIVYTYEDDVVTTDTKLTVDNIFEIKENIKKQILLCKKQNKKNITIFGSSLGALIAVLVANESQDVSHVILNSVGADFADVVWSWDHFKHDFKKRLIEREHITLEQLKERWEPISPIYHIDHLAGKRILVYLSQKDEVIPYRQGLDLVEALKSHNYTVSLQSPINKSHMVSDGYNIANMRSYMEFISRS